ncbi:MAG: MFS transporter, partial [Oscillospiraceae bacterium]
MKRERLWTRDYILIILMSTFQNAQNQLVNPIMARYNRDMGIDIGLIGVIVGVFSLAALVIRPLSGSLSDRLNNKLLAAVSALCMGISTIGYVVSGADIPLLLLFRFLHGLSFGICGTTLMRIASRLIPPGRMGEGMGFFGLGQVLSVAIAPGIGLFLAENFGYNGTFLVSAAVICGVGVLSLFLTMPPEAVRKKSGHTKFGISKIVAPEAVIFALIACMLFFANSVESNFIILYGEALGLQNLGLYFLVGALTMFFVRMVAGKLADKRGLKFVLVPSILCVALSMVILALAGILPVPETVIFSLFLLGAVVKAMGHAGAQPALQTACIQCVEPARAGLASGTFYMGCDIGMGVGP